MDVNVISKLSTDSYSSYKTATKKADRTLDKNREPVAYEKGTNQKPATYSINKMSDKDRANLVKQLKADQEAREKNLFDLVGKTLGKQAEAFALATGDDSVWKFLASGKYEVDEETKKQAEEDVSEDGYWGVKQTSQRLFDFASALAGDNVDKMQAMQKAMMKGVKEATKAWGRDLPEISGKTVDAANKLFDDYYKSKEA